MSTATCSSLSLCRTGNVDLISTSPSVRVPKSVPITRSCESDRRRKWSKMLNSAAGCTVTSAGVRLRKFENASPYTCRADIHRRGGRASRRFDIDRARAGADGHGARRGRKKTECSHGVRRLRHSVSNLSDLCGLDPQYSSESRLRKCGSKPIQVR